MPTAVPPIRAWLIHAPGTVVEEECMVTSRVPVGMATREPDVPELPADPVALASMEHVSRCVFVFCWQRLVAVFNPSVRTGFIQ